MTRICPGCSQERDSERDFAWKNKAKETRQRWCKACQAEANREHYQKNKDIYLNRALMRKARINTINKQKLSLYLMEHPCIDCNQNDIRTLEFDHIHGTKQANIARLINNAVPWKILEAEIEKCDVRWVNCHRIKTLERNNSWRCEPV